ncbi:MAG: DUF4381 domain-containing protein [bacterium]|nr:DUF4381 domain-containing protein [bacterium]
MKRTALAAFPRTTVAASSGSAWLAFLDATGGTQAFTAGPGAALVPLAYDPRAAVRMERADADALFDTVERWITEHRPC